LKKNAFTLFLFLLLGLLTGAIVAQLLSPVEWLSFLTRSAQIVWQPRADLSVIKYDISLEIRLNLISILGIALAIWIYRKL
jgi:hypothetical protein